MEETVAYAKYTTRDLIIYAIGIGCSRSYDNKNNQLNDDEEDNGEIRYLYEYHPSFCAFPLFPLALSFSAKPSITNSEQSIKRKTELDRFQKNSTSFWSIQPFPPYSMQSHSNKKGGNGIGPLPKDFIRFNNDNNQNDEDDEDGEDSEDSEDYEDEDLSYPVIHISQSLTIFHPLPVPMQFSKHQNDTENLDTIDPPITIQMKTRLMKIVPKRVGTFVTTETHYYIFDPPTTNTNTNINTNVSQNNDFHEPILLCSAQACTLILSIPPERVIPYEYKMNSSLNTQPSYLSSTFHNIHTKHTIYETIRKHFHDIVQKNKPSSIQIMKTSEDQAILYRLSGDYNPLHVDPKVASMANLEKDNHNPSSNVILHGLCTLGFAVRGFLQYYNSIKDKKISNGQLKHVSANFSKPVYINAELKVCLWQADNSMFDFNGITTDVKRIHSLILFQVYDTKRGSLVIDKGIIEVEVSNSKL